MGYNDQNAARLIFDIETAPLPDAAEYLEPSDAPANYKDPVKIAAYIAEENAKRLDRCGLDVDLCQVIAIGFQSESTPVQSMTLVNCDEDVMIRQFWQHFGGLHLVGFNCLAFDLPVLLRRSQYLGIPTPSIQIDRFKHPTVTDLLSVLSFNGAIKMRGLSFYAKRFGIPSTDTLTGTDIAQAVADGRWNDIRAHVEADVSKTAALAEKLGHFRHVAAAVL